MCVSLNLLGTCDGVCSLLLGPVAAISQGSEFTHTHPHRSQSPLTPSVAPGGWNNQQVRT